MRRRRNLCEEPAHFRGTRVGAGDTTWLRSGRLRLCESRSEPLLSFSPLTSDSEVCTGTLELALRHRRTPRFTRFASRQSRLRDSCDTQAFRPSALRLGPSLRRRRAARYTPCPPLRKWNKESRRSAKCPSCSPHTTLKEIGERDPNRRPEWQSEKNCGAKTQHQRLYAAGIDRLWGTCYKSREIAGKREDIVRCGPFLSGTTVIVLPVPPLRNAGVLAAYHCGDFLNGGRGVPNIRLFQRGCKRVCDGGGAGACRWAYRERGKPAKQGGFEQSDNHCWRHE